MIYKVSYHSMTASYGPSYIEASSPEEARRKFAGTAFSQGEMSLISVQEVPSKEIISALKDE